MRRYLPELLVVAGFLTVAAQGCNKDVDRAFDAYGAALQRSKVNTTRTAAYRLMQTAEQHYAQFSVWPTTDALLENKYVKPPHVIDPWGSTLILRAPSAGEDGRLSVCSKGPDMLVDTADDICVHRDP